MGVKIDSYCGLVCETCEFRETMNCGGCIATGGKPFHGHCDVAACAVEKKRAFCGDCAEFPCETLKAYSFDPVHGDDGARIENVRRQKAAKVAEARAGIDPVGVCGHHCDHCFLGQWCGGCRSDYDCCSFAGVCAGGKCPNKTCATEKGLSDCHACSELDDCAKGYFGAENGYTAKAASTFMRECGKQALGEALDVIRQNGMDDTNALRQTGSFDAAMKLLRDQLK